MATAKVASMDVEDGQDQSTSTDTTTGNLPLQASYLETLTEPLKSLVEAALSPGDKNGDDSTVKTPTQRIDQLEIGVRTQFLDLCWDGMEESSTKPLYQTVGDYWKETLNLSIHLVHFATQASTDETSMYHQMTPRRLPLVLLEDALEALPVDQAQLLWEHFVEPSLETQVLGETLWKTSTACHLQFLKVCNAFLRVVERGPDPHKHAWKGRILCALAAAFAISDRSALKFWGTFRSGDEPEYESAETYGDSIGADLPASTTTSIFKTTEVSFDLYKAFWSLQGDFGNPNKIKVADFIKKIRLVLDKLESAASSSVTKSPPSTSHQYLTAASLLPTQLATPSFRAAVLSQFIIISNHLSSESPALGKTLTPLLTRAKAVLQKDQPELHRLLCESLLIEGEIQWKQWKKDKCPVSAFAPQPRPDKEVGHSKSNPLLSAGILGGNDPNGKGDMYKALTREELLEATKAGMDKVPSLEKHLEEYVEALDPESGIEAEYHPGNDAMFAWRAMRLYSQQDLARLRGCRKPSDLERITRERYADKGEPIPGEMPPISEDTESEEEPEEEDLNNEAKSEDEEITVKDEKSARQEEGKDKPIGGAEKSDRGGKEEVTKTPREEDADVKMEDADENAEEKNKADETTSDANVKSEEKEASEDETKEETGAIEKEDQDVSKEKDEDKESRDKEAKKTESGSNETPENSESDKIGAPTRRETDSESSKQKEEKIDEARSEGHRSREASQENESSRDGGRSGRRDSSRKRKQSRSPDGGSGRHNKAPRGPPSRDNDRDRGIDRDIDRPGPDRRKGGPRGSSLGDGNRQDDEGGRDDRFRDDNRRDGGRRDDNRRNSGRRNDNRRDDIRLDDSRREENRRDNALRDDTRRDGGPRDGTRREIGRRDDYRRDNGHRDDNRRDDGRRDGPGRRDDSRRDGGRLEDNRRDDGRHDDIRRDAGRRDDNRLNESRPEGSPPGREGEGSGRRGPGRRNDGGMANRGGRRDDGPPPPRVGGSGGGPRGRQDRGPPDSRSPNRGGQGGVAGKNGGGQGGGDRRDDRQRSAGDRRRGGREDGGRFRGGRR